MQKKFRLGPLQRKWIRTLKSGKYKKAIGILYDESKNGYCCLGVANKCLNLGEVSGGYLTNEFDKIGLKSLCGTFDKKYRFPRGTKFYLNLVDMNDYGISHKKIAQFMEQNPELVFTKSC